MSVVETPTSVRAQAKWVRMSPRKARLVADHIRGRPVPEARTILAFTDRRAARVLEKVLSSAVANAEANHGLVGDELIVEAAFVDEGPVIKRWRARARGRVARIRKPTCHITLLLVPAPEPTEPAERPRRRRRTRAAEPEQQPAEVAEVTPAQEKEVEGEAAPPEEKPKRTRRKKEE
jgi:large subunit ribosomal protein L22